MIMIDDNDVQYGFDVIDTINTLIALWHIPRFVLIDAHFSFYSQAPSLTSLSRIPSRNVTLKL